MPEGILLDLFAEKKRRRLMTGKAAGLGQSSVLLGLLFPNLQNDGTGHHSLRERLQSMLLTVEGL